jgi:hypothetical protein
LVFFGRRRRHQEKKEQKHHDKENLQDLSEKERVEKRGCGHDLVSE